VQNIKRKSKGIWVIQIPFDSIFSAHDMRESKNGTPIRRMMQMCADFFIHSAKIG